MKPQSIRKFICIAALLTSAPSFAAVVGSNQAVNFNDTSTSFSYLGSTFTLTDNNDFFNGPTSISTQGSAAVSSTTFSGLEPSAYFDPSSQVFNGDPFLQYFAFTNPTPIKFSGPPTLLGLRVSFNNDFYYGYAQLEGQLLKSYGFETTPNLGILAGAPLSPVSAVPVPAAWALMLSAFSFFGIGIHNRRRSDFTKSIKLA